MATYASQLAEKTRADALPENQRVEIYEGFGLDIILTAALLIGLVALMVFNPFSVDPRQTLGLVLGSLFLGLGPTLLISGLEQILPTGGPRKSLRQLLLHVQITIPFYASGIPLAILAVSLSSALARYLHFNLGLIDLRFAGGGRLIVLVGALFLSVIIGDFFFYWYHRALHKSIILWQHHKLHHMDREYDTWTAWRQNSLETFFEVFFISLPTIVLFKVDEFDPFKLGLSVGVVIGAIQFIINVNHSNLRLQFGKASWLFLSYQYHRIHHSRLPQHQDKNFVAYFPLWDVLFGTYYHPARDEFPPTGVDGEKEIESFWESQIFPFREWWKIFREWQRRRLVA